MVAVFTVQFFLSVVLWNWWVSSYDWMLRYALCRLLGQYLKPSFSLLLPLFGKSECVTGGSGTAQVVWTKHRSPRRAADMRSHSSSPMYRGQKTTFRSQFCDRQWVPEPKLGSAGLDSTQVTYWVLSLCLQQPMKFLVHWSLIIVTHLVCYFLILGIENVWPV